MTPARRHLRHVYGPDVGEAELERDVRRLTDSYARYYLDSFRLPVMSDAEIPACRRR